MSLRRPQATDASRMCFAVAFGAAVAAAIGCVVNSFLTGWMATTGMLVVCMLYLAMGIFNLNWTTATDIEWHFAPAAAGTRRKSPVSRKADPEGKRNGYEILQPQAGDALEAAPARRSPATQSA
jgi:hypothetical protein